MFLQKNSKGDPYQAYHHQMQILRDRFAGQKKLPERFRRYLKDKKEISTLELAATLDFFFSGEKSTYLSKVFGRGTSYLQHKIKVPQKTPLFKKWMGQQLADLYQADALDIFSDLSLWPQGIPVRQRSGTLAWGENSLSKEWYKKIEKLRSHYFSLFEKLGLDVKELPENDKLRSWYGEIFQYVTRGSAFWNPVNKHQLSQELLPQSDYQKRFFVYWFNHKLVVGLLTSGGAILIKGLPTFINDVKNADEDLKNMKKFVGNFLAEHGEEVEASAQKNKLINLKRIENEIETLKKEVSPNKKKLEDLLFEKQILQLSLGIEE